MTEEIVRNRSEVLFVYDCKDANPNGDPLDENKPRIDEETGINIVTDVRLKRTIRDYLISKLGKESVFIRLERKEDGNLKTRRERIEEMKKEKKELWKEYLDLRLFGATIGLEEKGAESGGKGESIAITGPVQFRFGRSLHKVDGPILIKGTTVMPSDTGKIQGTFTETWILPYSLIAFYGIINENAAKDTGLTEEDVKLLLEGMWNGTKNLITRSKVGSTPRLLIRVVYKKSNYYIGNLDRKIKLITNKRDEELRDISDLKLDLSGLISALEREKENIEKIEYKISPDCAIEGDLKKLGVHLEELSF